MTYKIFDTEFDYEVVDVSKISLSSCLDKSLEAQKSIASLATNNNPLLYLIYKPIFLKNNNQYELIARHWSYTYYIINNETKIPGLIVYDKLLLKNILEITNFEIKLFKSPKKILSACGSYDISKSTKIRQKIKNARQICPFCSGPLRRHRNDNPSKGGMYEIHCENRNNRLLNNGKGCDFRAILTHKEFELFKRYELPTGQWLIEDTSKICSKCKDKVFLRKRYGEDGSFTVQRECQKSYSRSRRCSYVEDGGKNEKTLFD